MDAFAEVARGLVALHRRSPAAALTTTRWLVSMTPATARGVALHLASTMAQPLRASVLATGGLCVYAVGSPHAPVPIDQAPPGARCVARMVAYLANGEPGGAEAAWDALTATSSRWQVVETLHELACHVARADGGGVCR